MGGVDEGEGVVVCGIGEDGGGVGYGEAAEDEVGGEVVVVVDWDWDVDRGGMAIVV